MVAGVDLPDDTDDDGELFALSFLAAISSANAALEPIAPKADTAVDDPFRARLVAVPLTSLSVSSVGSRLTNSFCSNCTTTYGRAWIERTLRPRACMSLT